MPKDIEKLVEGYQHFHKYYFQEERALFDSLLKQGQKPKILIISCSDSRVDPSLLLHCQPGDLFVIRNVANLVPPFEVDASYHGTSAAVDFGVRVLGIRHVIVLGHTDCGGIKSLFNQDYGVLTQDSFIGRWMHLARQAYEITNNNHAYATQAEKEFFCSQYSVLNSLVQLTTFPWIKELLDKQLLFLHGWIFDLSSGTIQMFDVKQKKFVPFTVPVCPVLTSELRAYWQSLV